MLLTPRSHILRSKADTCCLMFSCSLPWLLEMRWHHNRKLFQMKKLLCKGQNQGIFSICKSPIYMSAGYFLEWAHSLTMHCSSKLLASLCRALSVLKLLCKLIVSRKWIRMIKNGWNMKCEFHGEIKKHSRFHRKISKKNERSKTPIVENVNQLCSFQSFDVQMSTLSNPFWHTNTQTNQPTNLKFLSEYKMLGEMFHLMQKFSVSDGVCAGHNFSFGVTACACVIFTKRILPL